MTEPIPPNAPRIIKQNSNKRCNLIGETPEENSNLSGHSNNPPDLPYSLSIEEETAIARLAQLFQMRGLVGGVLRLLLRIVKASGTAGATAVHADHGDYRLLLIAAIAEVRSEKARAR